MGWYSDQYKHKNKGYYNPLEKSQTSDNLQKPEEILSEITNNFKDSTIKPEIKKPLFNKNNNNNLKNWENTNKLKTLKTIIVLIPILIICYLIYQNILISKEFNYFYDIGKGDFLSPYSRITETIEEENDYRNLISSLVYFNVPIPRNAEKIKIQTRIKPNFPEDNVMIIGAKDRAEWHYKWDQIYNPSLNNLSQFKNNGMVYLINKKLYLVSLEELQYERNVIIASDNPFYNQLTNIINDFKIKETIINTSLRGGHNFFIYAKGDLNIEIKKQDINWYKGIDYLLISLYDSNDNLIENFTIDDDGFIEVNKNVTIIQISNFSFKNLTEGVYILRFSNFDGLIREIKINTNKIVSNRLFLADNQIYNVNQTISTVYFKTLRPTLISFRTWHNIGLQNVSINNQSLPIKTTNNATFFNTLKGNYAIKSKANDLILDSTNSFYFSEENYFEPYKQIIIPIRNDPRWLNNVDYLITDYIKPIEDNGWLIAETIFDIKKDNLYVKDNKLNLAFNVPHLTNQEYSNYTVPIDWINITVYKPSIFNKQI